MSRRPSKQQRIAARVAAQRERLLGDLAEVMALPEVQPAAAAGPRQARVQPAHEVRLTTVAVLCAQHGSLMGFVLVMGTSERLHWEPARALSDAEQIDLRAATAVTGRCWRGDHSVEISAAEVRAKASERLSNDDPRPIRV